jgi:DNA gyrase subunit A
MAKEKDAEIKEERKDGVVPVNISSEMKESYLDYAMSVITQRALPDVRDGLKPVHRRILFAMNEMGLTSSAKFRKSAAVVGDVLGKYHPHGDVAVYDTMVKMAQTFSYRYPLILGQGNFGSIDGDSAAAMRYTEAKMSRLSGDMLNDIEKNTVDFRPNYDGSRKEPIVLPTAMPNLVLNGTLGIAVGMATNIPPHNISEVIDACVTLIDKDDVTNEDILTHIKGPDFPTGGIIFADKEMRHAYASGRGGVVCRGEAEILETKQDQFQIIITSIPYRVVKSDLIVHIADLVRDKKLEGIKDIRDESTKDIRVVIDLKNGVHPQKVLNYIYKHSELETTFHFNTLALLDGVPQTLSFKSMLEAFLAHRQVVIRRRTQFDLDRALEREHILIGLKKALDHIEAIIKTIKKSKDTPTAQTNLMQEFKFSDRQATAILEMRLQKLAGLERKNIELELEEKQKLIKELKTLLASERKILELIKTEMLDIKAKYGDARRTKVVRGGVKEISDEDLVEDKESALVFTQGGYVKRTDPSEYRVQKRGGVGVVDLNTKEEDIVSILLTTSTHSDLLFFTDKGKAYQMKMYDIPEGRRATRGKSIMNFLSLSGEENVTSILPMPKSLKDEKMSLAMLTKNGTIKKVSADSFKDVRRSGLIAIKLDQGDELLSAFFTRKGDSIILATKKGQSIRFKESDVREMGRAAGGVRGVKLGKGDSVVGADVVRPDFKNPAMLVMMGNGYGKRTPMKEYKIQNRGGSGMKTAKTTPKTGDVIAAKIVTDDFTQIIAMSKKSQVVKVDLATIPLLGRATQGVRIMKPREGDSLASVTCL